ncbi:MAG: hypothetical protein HYY93_12995 [Planctomycetes bacterium]|nr:hypothetical protein [Planctomycetota bacterium]
MNGTNDGAGGTGGAPVLPAHFADPLDQLELDRFEWGAGKGLWDRFRIVEAILKARGAVIREAAVPGRIHDHVVSLLLIVVAFGALYGATIGMFGGGLQAAFAAVKVPIILLGTTFLCLPTFYVFNSLLGSKLTFGQTTMVLMLQTTAISIMLIGFTSVSWFFTVSAGGPVFMSFFHLGVFFIGLCFGVRLLDLARRYLDRLGGQDSAARGTFFVLWVLLFLVVGLQMAYHFRPLIGPGAFYTGERGFFLDALRGLGTAAGLPD